MHAHTQNKNPTTTKTPPPIKNQPMYFTPSGEVSSRSKCHSCIGWSTVLLEKEVEFNNFWCWCFLIQKATYPLGPLHSSMNFSVGGTLVCDMVMGRLHVLASQWWVEILEGMAQILFPGQHPQLFLFYILSLFISFIHLQKVQQKKYWQAETSISSTISRN